MLATCLRFGKMRSRIVDTVSSNAFGIYLLHYLFVVWLQFALLDIVLFAIAKAAIVFAASLGLAWAATTALRRNRFGCRLIGEAPGAPCR